MEFDDIVNVFTSTTFVWMLELRTPSGSYFFQNLSKQELTYIMNEIISTTFADTRVSHTYKNINVLYTNQWGEEYAGPNINKNRLQKVCRYIINHTKDRHGNSASFSQRDYWVSNDQREEFLDSLPLYKDKPFTPLPRFDSVWNIKFIADNGYYEYINVKYFELLGLINTVIKPRLEALCDMPLSSIKQRDYLLAPVDRGYKVRYKNVVNKEYMYPNIDESIMRECYHFLRATIRHLIPDPECRELPRFFIPMPNS
jgi:hypothetical protein